MAPDNDTRDSELPVDVAVDEGEVQRRLWRSFRESPLTIYPAAASAIGIITAIFADSPVNFFGGLAALGGVIMTGIVAAYHWSYLRDPIQRTIALETAREQIETEADVIRKLSNDLYSFELTDGKRELAVLEEAYRSFREFLKSESVMQCGLGLEVFNFETSVEQRRDRAIRRLRQAVEIARSIRTIDVDELTAELEDWERELRALRRTGKKDDSTEVKVLAKKIASQRALLDRRAEQERRVSMLIAECSEISGQLEIARLDLVEIVQNNTDSLERLHASSEGEDELDSKMKALRAVDERLRLPTEDPMKIYDQPSTANRRTSS